MTSNPGRDPIVHFVTLLHGCCNAIVAQAGPGSDRRDLTAFVPGGHTDLQDVPYSTSAADGTWHFRAACPRCRPAHPLDADPPRELNEAERARWVQARKPAGDPDEESNPRERTISGDFATATLTAYQESALQVSQGLRDVVWIERGGHAIAAIIPAAGAMTSWGTTDVMLTESGPVTHDARALILGRPGTGSSAEFVQAARTATAADPVWITDSNESGEFVRAVIIPAEEYHPPGTCCCKNCPWGGNHEPA